MGTKPTFYVVIKTELNSTECWWDIECVYFTVFFVCAWGKDTGQGILLGSDGQVKPTETNFSEYVNIAYKNKRHARIELIIIHTKYSDSEKELWLLLLYDSSPSSFPITKPGFLPQVVNQLFQNDKNRYFGDTMLVNKKKHYFSGSNDCCSLNHKR